MKTISSAAATEIAKQYATQPILVVEINWGEGSVSRFADKDIGTDIQGKLLSVGPIQSAINERNATSSQVTISLDDTDNFIKNQLDAIDIHKREVTVYQFYEGLDFTDDAFVLFVGQISTPFEWGENDRQVDFTVLSEIENYEVGFSPEEGQLDFVSHDLIGKPWPLVFGHCVHVPAQKVKQEEQATLLENFGIVDPTLDWKLSEVALQYQLESIYFTLWRMILDGADALAPECDWIVLEYVKAIIAEDIALAAVDKVKKKIEENQNLAKQFPKAKVWRLNIKNLRNDLKAVATSADAVKKHKEYIEGLIELARYEFDLKKKAAVEQIKSYNKMSDLHAQYMRLWREKCEQLQFFKECIKVQDSIDVFPQGTPTDVVIKGVRWRVQFDNETMCFKAGPVQRYSDLEVDPWTADDEVCSGFGVIDGQDMFRLTQNPAPNVEGMWLLVTKTDGTYHLVKVRKQENQKVYFNLVEWDRSIFKGLPRGVRLDNIVRDVVDTDFVMGPFGSLVPAGIFTGDFDPAAWNRPEAAYLLTLLQQTGPVSREELRNLAMLVFMIPSDRLGNTVWIYKPTPADIFTVTGPGVAHVVEACGMVKSNWLNGSVPFEEIPKKAGWSANPGTPITSITEPCEIYVANILPSTVKAVYAYRTNTDGERFLAPVPSRYYIKNEAANLGAIDVVSFTFPRALKQIAGERWEDDVYVTLESSVGPNVVDIIEHLINTYMTSKTPNAANFAAVKAKLQDAGEELYPAHFALFERPHVLEEIGRICWEARLGYIISGDEVFLKYLSEEPASDAALTDSDVEEMSVSVEYTKTEDLTTVMDASYKRTYLPPEGQRTEDPKIVLRHNVKKYGVHQVEEFFHIYNISKLVKKSATFWLIRRSNTWKKFAVKTSHHRIQLETLDTVTMDMSGGHLADAATKAVIEEATLDPKTNTITLRVDPGIRSGEMVQYEHFWPAQESATNEFPSSAEIEEGYAGGHGPASGVTGTIGDCP